jgi:UDP-N-acetylglucosamine 2-epimerase (non-hydrolysing)
MQMPKRIMCVVGARPNFMKIAPLMRELERAETLAPYLVHTGQHYDAAMKQAFFEQLHIPEPDEDLGVGSASHALQTAEIMRRFEPVLDRELPDAVLVVGDVNSTIACALVAAKKQTPVIHVEAGLRSFDRTMPEEINRVLTDQLSDLLFTTERGRVNNLEREGVDSGRVHFVGNVMIDTLLHHRERAPSVAAVLRAAGISSAAPIPVRRRHAAPAFERG